MTRPRFAVTVLAVAACATAAGCLGGTHNPSYFPSWLPGGDIIRTHAKPAGGGYFRDFDPKAARLEVNGPSCAAPPGAQQVLVATVYDKDGQPRRKRRVEWIVEGPGSIVEVDESGLLPGRGYKVDNKYAVSYTDYFEHTITRGNADPHDDFTVAAGQTWCVLSSAVPGETVVTAYAPEVFDWDKGRVTVRLVWADTPFAFPPPVVSRPGGEADLTTTLNKLTGKDSPSSLKVRYRVLDGAPALLVTKAGAGTTATLSGGGQKEAEVAADADGKAAVRVVQPAAAGGKTRIAVEVVKPDTGGFGPGTVLGKQETTVEWAAAQLALEALAPKATAVGRDAVFNLVVSNAGKAEGPPVTLKAALPADVEFVRADPAPSSREETRLTWTLPAVAAGQKQAVALTVRPSKPGTFTIPTSAETADGFKAESRATVGADRAGLKVAVEAPPQAGVGDKLTVRVAVTNPASVPAENVTAWVGFDAVLAHESGANPAEVSVGTVAPRETKKVDVPLTAKQPGKSAVRVNATADGGLADRAEATIEVRKAALRLTLAGPASLPLNADDAWELRVTNTGDVATPDAVARLTLPEALVAKSASDGGKLTGGIAEWRLGTLAPGETKAVRLTATADRLTDRAILSATAQSGGVQSSAEVSVAVVGKPALVLELSDAPAMLSVGKSATLRITVRNSGTGPARKVEVTATTTEHFTPTGGTGADRKPAVVEGGKLTFGVLDELPPGSAAVFVLDVEASQPGAARLQAEVRADHLSQPLREEQAARVIR